MDSIKDSAKPAGQTEMGEDTVMAIADESKAQEKNDSPQIKKRGTKGSKKSLKQKLNADGNPIQKKPRAGGRQKDDNSTKLMPHDRYKTVEGEMTKQRNKRL